MFWGYGSVGESESAIKDFIGVEREEHPSAQEDWAPGSEVHIADRMIKAFWLG